MTPKLAHAGSLAWLYAKRMPVESPRSRAVERLACATARRAPLSLLHVLTRFAPAPTGYLHLGHVVNALHVWGAARARDGQVILRIEDHDRQRSRLEYETAIIEDLAWLGFKHDGEVIRQRERDAHLSQGACSG